MARRGLTLNLSIGKVLASLEKGIFQDPVELSFVKGNE
jgi:hypothetical protein